MKKQHLKTLLIPWSLALTPIGGLALAQSPPGKATENIGTCPVMGEQAGPDRNTAARAMSNGDWRPGNATPDKARRLLWPIKQQDGQEIPWTDLTKNQNDHAD